VKRSGNLRWVDPGQPLTFTFEGETVPALARQSIAAALYAAGRRTFTRSFKYHRPRGLMSAGIEEPNGLLTLGSGGRREPNLPATMTELTEGIVATTQNRWPSVGFDLRSVNELAAPLLAAGFYYKTFMGPRRGAWMIYEPHIRRAAGLGSGTFEPDPDRYETRHEFADLLVIGGGPAGLSAAIAAGRAGARVALAEQDALLGVIVLGALGGAHAAVLRDDSHVPRRDRPRDVLALGVQVHLHPVGVLSGAVLARHHVSREHDQSFLLPVL